ncbi:MAG: hypothetical protein J0H60_07225 [Rhizobiales bacterium]|nr:hypothetical protein [Hyphomicrobiales bacterium]
MSKVAERISTAAGIALLAVLSGCQSGGHGTATGENSAAVALLQRVNTNAHTCWVKSKDKDFQGYSVIPELDTQAGKPVKATAYGPLLNQPAGGRIGADLKRWTGGSNSCTA